MQITNLFTQMFTYRLIFLSDYILTANNEAFVCTWQRRRLEMNRCRMQFGSRCLSPVAGCPTRQRERKKKQTPTLILAWSIWGGWGHSHKVGWLMRRHWSEAWLESGRVVLRGVAKGGCCSRRLVPAVPVARAVLSSRKATRRKVASPRLCSP